MASQKRGSLSVVTEETAKTPAKKAAVSSVSAAALNGTRRDLLVAMRTRVAKDVEDANTPSRDLAALTRRLLEIVNEIEAIDVAAEQEALENGEAADEEFDASAV